jgi:5-amino-6-(5-phosphoribosylamino)uracil reductase
MQKNRPFTTVILAMSADGKIADTNRKAARFGSTADKAHLEEQIATNDAVIFGANTLRAYGTTLTITNSQLLQSRTQAGKPPQPIHIVISQSGRLNPEIRFFQQSIRRWLLTTSPGALSWEKSDRAFFEETLVFDNSEGKINLELALQHLMSLGIQRLAVLGGGQLVASMMELDLIDEIWLTICPLILGGSLAPTPVAGGGFLPNLAPRLQLLACRTVEQEVFLHYRLIRELINYY